MSNEKNNTADNKIDVIISMAFAGLFIFIGVIFLVTHSPISYYPTIFLLAIMSIGMGWFLAIPYSIILLKYPKYATFIFFMVAGVFLIVIGVSSFFTVQGVMGPYGYTHPYSQYRYIGISYMPQIVCIVGGFILLIRSSIKFSVKNVRQKKLDSMSQSDLAKMFDCPSSGKKGAVHLIKLVKDQILVKQSCPTLAPYGWTSKVRLLRIPLRLKDQCVSHFRDAVFRCFKCGEEATVDQVKLSGPWTLIKLSCPTHGKKIPTHKIWSSVYSDISNEGIATPQQVQPQPIPSEEKWFCRNCGEKYKDAYQKVCQNCGLERYI